MPGDLGSFAPFGLDLSAITGRVDARFDQFEEMLVTRFDDLRDAVADLKTTTSRVADQLADLLANGALTSDQAAVLDQAIADLRGADSQLEAVAGDDPAPEPEEPTDPETPAEPTEPEAPVDEPPAGDTPATDDPVEA